MDEQNSNWCLNVTAPVLRALRAVATPADARTCTSWGTEGDAQNKVNSVWRYTTLFMSKGP